MKKFPIYITFLLSLSMSGCILDSLNDLPLNIPISVPFVISGNDDLLYAEEDFCLDDSELFMDYKDDIKEIQLLEISLRPAEFLPEALNGDLRIIIKETGPSGQVYFYKTYANFTFSQYTSPNNPFVVPASREEFIDLNKFLNGRDKCFTASISLINSMPAGFRSVSGYLDFVFRTTTDLNS